MVGGKHSLKFFSFPAFTVSDRQCLEDSEQKDDLINKWIIELINEEGVYRTATATMYLLNIFH